MRKPAQPASGAERQRAYRERHKDDIALAPPKEPGDEDEEVSVAQLNARLRAMTLQVLDAVGRDYLLKLAQKSPNTFMRFAGQFVTKEEVINPGAYQFFIQQVNIQGAQPVRGVIASPVAEHIDASRVLPGPGTVVDEDRE